MGDEIRKLHRGHQVSTLVPWSFVDRLTSLQLLSPLLLDNGYLATQFLSFLFSQSQLLLCSAPSTSDMISLSIMSSITLVRLYSSVRLGQFQSPVPQADIAEVSLQFEPFLDVCTDCSNQLLHFGEQSKLQSPKFQLTWK